MGFREDFVWGAATASYQIEGAAFEDGKGLSVWDNMCRKEGAVFNGHTGKVACNHYHLYKDDVQIMKQIGLKGYRFSLSWPRIMPEGTGRVNPKGIDFYSRLIDELLANGITPYITLFHWDYPYELYCRGGWLNEMSLQWFAEYTQVVMENFSDRVSNWMTLNEPQCFVLLGHQTGIHAPGDKLSNGQILCAMHNSLLAHGRAVQVIRANAKIKPVVGFAPVGVTAMPASDSDEDVEYARSQTFGLDTFGFWSSGLWFDPVFRGEYPKQMQSYFSSENMPRIKDGDMKIISEPVDYCGFNVYRGWTVSKQDAANVKGFVMSQDDSTEIGKTDNETSVTPKVMYWASKFLYERYQKPITITENGMADTEWVSLDGQVHDPQRIDFLARYISSLKKAADEGVDVSGYFIWSLMDNFEWALGYSRRFGIVYVDYASQKRILKDSARWYKRLIETNGEEL